MGYINFQLQNNSFSIIFQASGKKKKNPQVVICTAYFLLKSKNTFKAGIKEGISGNIAKKCL